jgi:hypothetical protein
MEIYIYIYIYRYTYPPKENLCALDCTFAEWSVCITLKLVALKPRAWGLASGRGGFWERSGGCWGGAYFSSIPFSDDGYAALGGLLRNGRRAAGSERFFVSAFSSGDCYRRADTRATRWKAPFAFQVKEDSNSCCHVRQKNIRSWGYPSSCHTMG